MTDNQFPESGTDPDQIDSIGNMSGIDEDMLRQWDFQKSTAKNVKHQ